jgi:hypothetical protein
MRIKRVSGDRCEKSKDVAAVAIGYQELIRRGLDSLVRITCRLGYQIADVNGGTFQVEQILAF